MNPRDELVPVELTEDGLDLLRAGLHVWGGPVTCTQEMAVAMGFDGLDDFRAERKRIYGSLWPSASLSRIDWTRALLCTEIAFTSYVAGAAWDWRIVTGFDDPEALRILRDLQQRFSRARALVAINT
ncbi:hypothetical protein [Microlunatus antarcticus]|uniref:Uncharacterized protein n=1 Tax=Microlunatus antarcticus TaxID=53388 RepID=A0A7W5JXP7_9ACTN|nr:hypothetical protein [Microlunatus antarcticus]MBB3328257.1 hypothetical protein [Microlunatus antarcticus]